MAGLDTIVNISIERKTSAVPRASFGIGAFMGEYQRVAAKAATYTEAAALLTAGYLATDPEYLAALAYFSQSPQPEKLIVGTRAGTVTVTPTATNSTAYTLTFKVPGSADIAITYNSDASATVAEITAGLTTAINANGTIAPYLTATDNTTNLSIVADVAGNVFGVKSTGAGTLAVTFAATETIANFLVGFRAANDLWYAIGMHSRVSADIQTMAAQIEPLKRLFVWQCNDSDLITAASTDPGSILKAASYARSFGFYHSSDSEYLDMGALAQLLVRDPGKVTLANKTIAGVTVDTIDATAQGYLDGKNICYYVAVGGVNITQGGKVAVGEWVDVMRDIDYLHVNMQADIFDVLTNNAKVPYTDLGIAQVESVIRSRLNGAARSGILVDDKTLYVTVPKASAVASADKATRTLTGIKFGGTLQGAVHFVRVAGTVAV